MPSPAKNVVQQYATVMVATLAALGYVIVSPKEQIEALSRRIQEATVTQRATDERQDQQLQLLTERAADDKREIQSDLNLLIISQCLTTKSSEVYAQLKCNTRLGRRQ